MDHRTRTYVIVIYNDVILRHKTCVQIVQLSFLENMFPGQKVVRPKPDRPDRLLRPCKDLLLLAGREVGPERWLLFTEPAPTLKEAQLDFLRFLLRGRKDGQGREGFNEE